MVWSNWRKGQPDNLGGIDDCGVNFLYDGKDKDEPCTVDLCPVCQVQTQKKFRLRGVCLHSDVDSFYMLKHDRELLGYRQSKMVWSRQDNRWNIVNLVNEKILAYANSTSAFPIGTHPWFFTDGNCTDHEHQSRNMNLHLAKQQPGNFCCDDGLCIDSELRCDNNQDCEDLSDEFLL